MRDTLWLVGMMASGKSTVGRLVAGGEGARFLDTDDLVEEEVGRSVPEMWEAAGEEGFRAAEADVVLRLAGARADPRVVATGGGVVLRGDLVEAMRGSGLVVWLDAAPETLEERVGGGEGRPLLAGGPGLLSQIDRSRRELYETACHHRVPTDHRTPEEVAEEVRALWTGS